MRCQSLFSGENETNIVSVLSAELAQRVGKVMEMICKEQ